MSLLLFAAFAAAVFVQPPAPKLDAAMIVLGVSEMVRSIKFYRETLALSPAPAPGDLPIFEAGKLKIVLNGAMPTQSAGVEVVFSVESVAGVRKHLEDRGCTFDAASREVAPGAWVATFRDPDGHRLTLFGAR